MLRITTNYALQTLCCSPHKCCNDEGKLNGMEMNRRVGDDIICGPFFLVGEGDDGEFRSLTEDEVKAYTERFAKPEQFADYEPDAQPRMEFYSL